MQKILSYSLFLYYHPDTDTAPVDAMVLVLPTPYKQEATQALDTIF